MKSINHSKFSKFEDAKIDNLSFAMGGADGRPTQGVTHNPIYESTYYFWDDETGRTTETDWADDPVGTAQPGRDTIGG